jgi:uncharacterized membrane protein
MTTVETDTAAELAEAQADRLAVIRAHAAAEAAELEAVRVRVAAMRAARLAGPVGRAWPHRADGARPVRWPSNLCRRPVVALWPVADRARWRAAAVAAWAVLAVLAVLVTLALIVVLGAISVALRPCRWALGRARARREFRRHRKAWAKYHAEQARYYRATQPPAAQAVRRRRLGPRARIILGLVGAAYGLYMVVMVVIAVAVAVNPPTPPSTPTTEVPQ